MPIPELDVVPLRRAVRSDMATTLDVLVRIVPPAPEVHFVRPPINLGLVLDHSGSMSTGKKMAHAREAAVFAVQQLQPTDRVSVTIFDDTVETIVPNTPATDRAGIIRLLQGVQPGGSTALHAGWAEGGDQVGRHRIAEGLNRVILLSDGLANVGLTDPNAIAAEVKAMSRKQVGTTTMGVGSDYNEDLMEAMATSGDGNYYYIEDPRQLPDIFQTELQGLMATSGQKVSLGLEPQNGVTVSDVLNDLEKDESGRLMLSNLVAGNPISVVVRLNVPPSVRPGICAASAWPGTIRREGAGSRTGSRSPCRRSRRSSGIASPTTTPCSNRSPSSWRHAPRRKRPRPSTGGTWRGRGPPGRGEDVRRERPAVAGDDPGNGRDRQARDRAGRGRPQEIPQGNVLAALQAGAWRAVLKALRPPAGDGRGHGNALCATCGAGRRGDGFGHGVPPGTAG